MGEVELKGLPEPVATSELGWEPLPAVRVPLPDRLQTLPETSYVGRRPQRDLLATMWKRAANGERQIALLSGEPGIGKTRLATYAAMTAHRDGAIVLYGHCDEDFNVAYQPWVEALRHLVEVTSTEVLEAHVAAHGGELTRLVPELAARVANVPAPRESEPETERLMLFTAIRGLLEIASAAEPLVVFLDDVHWADRPSLSLLKHVAASGAPLQVLVLATYRDSDVSASDPLTAVLADLRREPGVEWIGLDGLAPDEVLALVEAAAGHEMDAEGAALASAVSRDTDGNPFFVGELLRHLLESGGVVQGPDGRYVVDGDLSSTGLPRSVRDVVGQRVARLGEPTVKALGVASVIGREFDLDLLAAASDSDPGDLLDLLEAAVGGSVLRESATTPGRFIFVHALINHTLYEDLSRTRQALLHRRVAEALEEICGDDPGDRIAELAHQWSSATTPVDLAKAIDYSHRAGVRALESLAPAEAMTWFDRALEQLATLSAPDLSVRCEVLIRRGEAQKQTGDHGFRETFLEAADIAARLGDVDQLTRAALYNTRGMWAVSGAVDEPKVAALRAAANALPEDSPQLARVLGQLALELQFAHDEAENTRAMIDGALALARTCGDTRILAEVLISVCGALGSRPELVEERFGLIVELTNLVADNPNPVNQYLAGMWGAVVELQRGNLAGLDDCISRMHDVAEVVGQSIYRAYLPGMRATRALLVGNLDEAEALSNEFMSLGTQAGFPEIFAAHGSQIGMLRLEQDRLSEIVELIEYAVSTNPGLPTLQAVLASYYGELGRRDEARALLDAAAPNAFELLPRDLIRLTGLARFSQVAYRTGAVDHAAVLYDLIRPYQDHLINTLVTVAGSGHLFLGRLADLLERCDVAEEHFIAAEAKHRSLEAPLLLARTWLYWAEMLLRRGEGDDAARAADLLRQARETAEVHGGVATVRAVDELLASA